MLVSSAGRVLDSASPSTLEVVSSVFVGRTTVDGILAVVWLLAVSLLRVSPGKAASIVPSHYPLSGAQERFRLALLGRSIS